MELKFLSPGIGTIDCRDGHLLLVNLKRPEEAHQQVLAQVKNDAQRIPMLRVDAIAGFMARGYASAEWGAHTALTDPDLAEGETWPPDPALASGPPMFTVPDDPTEPEAPATPNMAPAVPTEAPGRAELEALGDDELRAMAVASGCTHPAATSATWAEGDRAALIAAMLGEAAPETPKEAEGDGKPKEGEEAAAGGTGTAALGDPGDPPAEPAAPVEDDQA